MKRITNFSHGSGNFRHFSGTLSLWRPLKSRIARTTIIFFFVIFIGAFISVHWIDISIKGGSTQKVIQTTRTLHKPSDSHITPKRPKRLVIPLNCSAGNLTRTCPANYPTSYNTNEQDGSPTPVCPDYFRWIHEDLLPWKETGITREMVERARRTANFRVVILNGRVYIEKFKGAFENREVFTLWGILQLLRRYPGKLPDLELMFDSVDLPVILAKDHRGPNATAPPPLFRYCADEWTLDIVFPDWSFWGWPDINIRPWDALLKELRKGNENSKWIKREPYAYWKGNPFVAKTRQNLLKCNVTNEQDWNARLYVNDWGQESREGFKKSNLASQCTHRFKVYIEGYAWSVSEKYILACDSVTLLIKPHYYHFLTRSLEPMKHYWPIRDDDKCRSIKFAVDWGNSHEQKAQAIGKAASNFIQEELKMDYVYDYMFHLLYEYAKLLKFKPAKPPKAIEFCSETMACAATGLEKKFMMESMEKGPSVTNPCILPPPLDPPVIQGFLRRKTDLIKEVETWEKNYWDNLNKHP